MNPIESFSYKGDNCQGKSSNIIRRLQTYDLSKNVSPFAYSPVLVLFVLFFQWRLIDCGLVLQRNNLKDVLL